MMKVAAASGREVLPGHPLDAGDRDRAVAIQQGPEVVMGLAVELQADELYRAMRALVQLSLFALPLSSLS